ncbi:MAG: hypothetical protein LKF52_04890 [Butyrivibrio sp.]|jgi:uncharacterized protein YdeI (BOF family)|nr:hypothetical protein [Butyrivibrio sp.]
MMKRKVAVICTAVCLAFTAVTFTDDIPVVQAATETTVSGTVVSGSTDTLLYLSTAGGKMEIKIDSNADTSGCKILLPDKKVTVTCYRGSDAYMHASRITSTDNQKQVTVDTSKTATVEGTVITGTTDDLLYFSTSGGTMQIKMDDSTDMSGCSIVTLGKKLVITCGRGSDACMHAIKVSDSSSASSSTTASINGVTMPNITGTVAAGTTSSYLYFSTSAGLMEIKIDSSTDLSSCRTLIPGQSITVACYRGSDAYMHAGRIIDNTVSSSAAATVNSTRTITVSGTVTSDTSSQILFLSTSGGIMQIKLDGNTQMNGNILVIGEKILVTCGSGSDAFLHAISISAN